MKTVSVSVEPRWSDGLLFAHQVRVACPHPYLVRIVFHAPRPRVILLVLHLVLRHHAPILSKNDAARTARALIDARNVLRRGFWAGLLCTGCGHLVDLALQLVGLKNNQYTQYVYSCVYVTFERSCCCLLSSRLHQSPFFSEARELCVPLPSVGGKRQGQEGSEAWRREKSGATYRNHLTMGFSLGSTGGVVSSPHPRVPPPASLGHVGMIWLSSVYQDRDSSCRDRAREPACAPAAGHYCILL